MKINLKIVFKFNDQTKFKALGGFSDVRGSLMGSPMSLWLSEFGDT